MNLYLGIMSGTSLDGVDLALVDFFEKPNLVASGFVPMPEDLRANLAELLKSGETSLQKLGEIDHRLGVLYADCVNDFLVKISLRQAKLPPLVATGRRFGTLHKVTSHLRCKLAI